MTDIEFKRADYLEALPLWNLVSDAAAGEHAVKGKGDKYLPRPNPDDNSKENQARFDQYLLRAVYYNATGRTKHSLIGAAFRKSPKVEFASHLDYVNDDIDGAGVGLTQQSQTSLAGVLENGRVGLLVDYPDTRKETNQADIRSGKIRATITAYKAENVINWRVERIGFQQMLTLVVLAETHESIDDLKTESQPQYRVLKLTEEGYSQEVWRQAEGSDEFVLTEGPYLVMDGEGKNWDEIPFVFIGAINNDHTIDPSPLYDMAVVNIAHYRNSADYEDSVYYCGQAQPYMSGLTEDWRNWLEQNGIRVGSRSPILLPVNGEFGYAQVQPNSMAKEAMDQKEKHLIALGARLIQPGSAIKTATEAQGEQEAEHSVLSLACMNVSAAYTQALIWLARFMRANNTTISYGINTDFIEHKLDAPMLTALIGAWQSGRLPNGDLWNQFRKYGLIDTKKSDEAIQEEIDSQSDTVDLDD